MSILDIFIEPWFIGPWFIESEFIDPWFVEPEDIGPDDIGPDWPPLMEPIWAEAAVAARARAALVKNIL
jgi:hypothetical protein